MKQELFSNNQLIFQLIVESSPSAIVVVNKEGHIAYVNDHTEKLFGYTRAELVGQFVEILIPPRYREKHPEFRSRFLMKPVVQSMGAGHELFAIRKDKTEFPIEIGQNPLTTDYGTFILASIIDISERKKAEEQFRLVVESAPNAMVLVNKDGIITLVNRQAEILFGYNRQELINSKLEILIPDRFRTYHPGYRDSFFQKLQTRSMGVGRDLFGKRKDGVEIQVEIGLNPIETAHGQMVLASIIDITERKIQEASLKKQVALEIRNKELERFAYLASHDLQEPLRTVSNYMLVFEEDYAGILDDTGLKYLRSVNQATARMSKHIRALRDFSLLGRNKKLVCVDCKKIVENVIADLRHLINESKATINVGELPTLNLYETEIGLLFQALITNAIKFKKKDVDPEIRINSVNLNGRWLFSISDNGIGISACHYDRIFEIFQRLHSIEENDGNGIGLANCKKIVEFHEGEIWVDSTLEKGTTFNFTIPHLEI